MISDKRKEFSAKELEDKIRELSHESTVREIVLTKLIVTGQVVIDDAIQKPIYFQDCIFENIDFQNKGTGELVLENCEINELKWNSSKANNLSVLNCNISTLLFSDRIETLDIQGGTINFVSTRSEIDKIKIGDYLDFEDVKDNKIKIPKHIKSVLSQIIIHSSKLHPINELYIEKADIGLLAIYGIIPPAGLYSIKNCSINHTNIISLENEGSLKIIGMNPLNSSSEIDLIKYSKNSGFIIHNSRLNDCEFESIDFREFDNIAIRKSPINNISLIDVQWPKSVNRESIRKAKTKAEKKIIYKDIAEVYKQIILAHRKENDKIQQITTNAYYLNAYRKSLGNSRIEISERILLFLGRWTNNFRLDWPLALAVLLFGSIIIFLCLICFDPCLSIKQNWSDIFKFLNPARPYEYIKGCSLSDKGIFIDFIGRVFVAFMLFQFIQAIRKHTWTS